MDLLQAAEADDSGRATFERYLWQTKQAVRHWLMCLGDDDLLAVVCERVDDLVLVRSNALTFVQLKTRDKGSWSAKRTCDAGRGIDALIRSHQAMESQGLSDICSYKLLLEGPPAEDKETNTFFADPTKASAELRAKLSNLGLASRKIHTFLTRLTIVPHEPHRSHIDDVLVRLIGSQWRSLTGPQCESLYEQLLQAAATAQEGKTLPWSIRARLGDLAHRGLLAQTSDDPFTNQILHRTTLSRLTPPLPDESAIDFSRRLAENPHLSPLELKLMIAGATRETIERAQNLRADADTRRLAYLASTATGQLYVDQLSTKLLTMARAVAAAVAEEAATNPAALARPADRIMNSLQTNPANLLVLDPLRIFESEPDSLLGHLCSLSDQCHFSWKAS